MRGLIGRLGLGGPGYWGSFFTLRWSRGIQLWVCLDLEWVCLFVMRASELLLDGGSISELDIPE